jgi:D-alanyl-lipoteichoic acid acyltransferase DltB (MBOAT superfamily)
VRVCFLVVSILCCLGILFFYKYWDLFDEGLVHLSALSGGGLKRQSLNLVAPLGLSYFTFASLSYTLDVFRHRCRVEKNPFHYAMFVSFFPTLFTGPIERYPHMRPQIEKSRRFSYKRCAGGAFRILWGYTKKMVLADNLAKYVSFVYTNSGQMSGPNLLAATALFVIQLYMDFSGCCDIALGVGRILGYDLLENFQSPFESTTFSEFWSRWHASMTGWFRDYLYFPLGGSRCSVFRHMCNLMVVFVVSGLWHGADWRFLMWGVACGAISVAAKLTERPRAFLGRHNPLYRCDAFRRWFQRAIVFCLFAFTLVFFASALYAADPYAIYRAIPAGWHGLAAAGTDVQALLVGVGIDGRMPVVLTVGVLLVFAVESNRRRISVWIRRQNFVLRWTLYYACGAAILFFGAFGKSIFIYQAF